MTSTVTTTQTIIENIDHIYKLALKFEYVTEEYKEISNNKAFNFETLCSQVGGFVGK